jgi:hypothetical protein
VVDQNLLLMLKSSGIGDCEPDLGEKLLRMYLDALYNSGTYPAKVICLGSGIFLTTGGSDGAGPLERFQAHETEILSCSTCLNYYKREDRLVIGKTTNMKAAVAAMLDHARILQP